MHLIDRREAVIQSTALGLCLALPTRRSEADGSPVDERIEIVRSSDELHIHLGRLTPDDIPALNLQRIISSRAPSELVVITSALRISPVGTWDARLACWIDLFESMSVQRVVETSGRGGFETHPLRAGQLDPAGIVYLATGRHRDGSITDSLIRRTNLS